MFIELPKRRGGASDHKKQGASLRAHQVGEAGPGGWEALGLVGGQERGAKRVAVFSLVAWDNPIVERSEQATVANPGKENSESPALTCPAVRRTLAQRNLGCEFTSTHWQRGSAPDGGALWRSEAMEG